MNLANRAVLRMSRKEMFDIGMIGVGLCLIIFSLFYPFNSKDIQIGLLMAGLFLGGITLGTCFIIKYCIKTYFKEYVYQDAQRSRS